MSKYCMSCGKWNDDTAAFCVACGKAFPGVEQGRSTASSPESGVYRPTFVPFTAEMGPGAHEHVSSDVSLRDDKGAVIYVAKRPSLLHVKFEIVDSEGQTRGYVNRKTHITHTSYEICDPNDNVLNVIKMGAVRNRRFPPNCSLEDASGNTRGKFEFSAGIFSFGLVKSDGSKVFDARLTTEGGILQRLKDLSSKRYEIDVYDNSFSALMLVGTIASIDTASA